MVLEQRAKDLFFDALDVPQAQQDDFLLAQCGDDNALYQEVAELLLSHQQAPDFLQGLAQNVLGNEWLTEPGSSADPHDLIGKNIAHYQVTDTLGMGAMGVVYKAHDQRLQRTVALKLLPPFINNDETARKRFIHEARTASTLDHPNIGTIFTIEELDNHQVVIVMAHYQGVTLRELCHDHPTPAATLLPIFIQLAQGLKSAHDNGIVHRDIKPANIMVLTDGSVKVLDFGLSKMDSIQLTTTVNSMGTLAYMSPEHIRGEVVDSRTDIWAFGVIMYELLSGFKPFNGDNAQAMSHAITQQPIKLSHLQHLPIALIRLVKGCLQRDTDKRIASSSEIFEQLKMLSAEPLNQNIEQNASNRFSRWWLKKLLLSNIGQHKQFIYISTFLAAIFLGSLFYPLVDRGSIKSTVPVHTQLPKQQHIAVLPIRFSQSTPSKAELNLGDGLFNFVNQSVATLAQSYPSMWVVPAAKVSQYKINTLTEAANIFGVNLILQVDIQYEGRNAIVNLKLIEVGGVVNGPDKNTVLAQTLLRRPQQAKVILQEDIATALFSLFDLAQNPQVRRGLTQGSTINAAAFEYFTRALALMQRKNTAADVAQSIKLLHQAVAVDQEYVDAYALMADAYWHQYSASKDPTQAKLAEQYSDKVLQLDSSSLSAYLTLGKIHNATGRYGLARAVYELALQQTPDNGAVYIGLAKTYKNDKQYDKAEQNYRRAIALTPGYWEYHHYLGVFFLRRGRYQEAIQQYGRVVELVPNNAMGYNNLAIAHWYSNEIDKAIALFLRAVALEKSYSRYNNLASLYYYQRDYHRAASMYEQALLLNDKDYKVWGNLADSYIWSNKPRDQIETTLNKAIELAQLRSELLINNATVLSNLAAYYSELGHTEQAQALLQQAVDNKPTELEVIFSIAVVYEKLGQRKVALKWIKKALQNGYSLIEVENHPELITLRQDQRYHELIERFGQAPK